MNDHFQIYLFYEISFPYLLKRSDIHARTATNETSMIKAKKINRNSNKKPLTLTMSGIHV